MEAVTGAELRAACRQLAEKDETIVAMIERVCDVAEARGVLVVATVPEHFDRAVLRAFERVDDAERET